MNSANCKDVCFRVFVFKNCAELCFRYLSYIVRKLILHSTKAYHNKESGALVDSHLVAYRRILPLPQRYLDELPVIYNLSKE